MKRRVHIAFVSVLLAIFCFASAASADLLYTRQDNSYANTALGIIQNGGSPVHPLASNIGGNSGQTVSHFINKDGESKILVSLYSGGTSDVINVYSPDAEAEWSDTSIWSAPKDITTSLSNTRKMVSSGDYLYGIDYDNGIVNKISFADDTYTETATYTYELNNYTTPGEGLVAYNGKLYAIFSAYDVNGNLWDASTNPYAQNRLIKFDENLNVEQTVQMHGKNLDGFAEGAYTRSGNKLYVATLGGVQPYDGSLNEESCIEIVDLDTMEITQAITAEEVNAGNPDFSHMFQSVVVAGDKVYIQATKWDYTNGNSIRVYETTESALENGDIGNLVREFKDFDGWKSSMLYEEETNYLWCAVGYSLYRYDGSAWTEYNADALGGNISAFGVTESLAAQTAGTGGGGCNGGFGAVALIALAFAPLVMRDKKRARS